MIHPDSRTLPWIQEVAEKYHFKEIQLIEKSIRAFSLLEALVRSGDVPSFSRVAHHLCST